MRITNKDQRLIQMGAAWAVGAGLVLGLAMRPNYEAALHRSSPRQELQGPVSLAGRNAWSDTGLSIVVSRPWSSLEDAWLRLARPPSAPRPALRAPPLEVAEVDPRETEWAEAPDPDADQDAPAEPQAEQASPDDESPPPAPPEAESKSDEPT